MKTSAILVDALIFSACLAIIVPLYARQLGGGDGYLQVESADGTYRYSMATDATYHIPGPLGETEIEIKGGTARIVDSPCPTKSCTHQPPISDATGWIACLPNQVLLTVVSSSQEHAAEVDDVSN
jgi:hypothetical protein